MSPKRSGRAPCIDSAQKLRISVCSKCGASDRALLAYVYAGIIDSSMLR
jgi:hypothetical protein